jgi:hypothetical protein
MLGVILSAAKDLLGRFFARTTRIAHGVVVLLRAIRRLK